MANENNQTEPTLHEVNLDDPALKNRVIIINGYSDQEVLAILRAVKALTKTNAQGDEPAIKASSGDLIFAKTTKNSLRMVLAELICDMSGDHEYLKKNPPNLKKP